MLGHKEIKETTILLLWMTDDARRLPLRAEIEFRYGTFDIDLIKTGNAVPTGQ